MRTPTQGVSNISGMSTFTALRADALSRIRVAPPHVAIGDLSVLASCAYAATPLCLGCLQLYTQGRILGWTPNAHSANVCLASCAYAAERIGRSIEEKVPWDPPVFLKRPRGPTR